MAPCVRPFSNCIIKLYHTHANASPRVRAFAHAHASREEGLEIKWEGYELAVYSHITYYIYCTYGYLQIEISKKLKDTLSIYKGSPGARHYYTSSIEIHFGLWADPNSGNGQIYLADYLGRAEYHIMFVQSNWYPFKLNSLKILRLQFEVHNPFFYLRLCGAIRDLKFYLDLSIWTHVNGRNQKKVLIVSVLFIYGEAGRFYHMDRVAWYASSYRTKNEMTNGIENSVLAYWDVRE